MNPVSAQPVSPSFNTDDVLNGDSVEGAGAVGEPHEETIEGREISTEEEEVEPQRIVRTPYTPSASEVAEHRVTHTPYRDWCDECREAFGREAPHAHVEHRAAWVPVVSTDYLFMSARGVFTRDEWSPQPGENFLNFGDNGRRRSLHVCTCGAAERSR